MILSDPGLTSANPDLVGRTDRDLEFGVCVPSTWTSSQPPLVTLPNGKQLRLTGIARGWVSQDAQHSAGVYVYRLYPPVEAVQPGAVSATIQQTLKNVVTLQSVFPADLQPDASTDLMSALSLPAVLHNGFQLAYSAASVDIEAWAVAGITSDQAIVIGIVWGPHNDMKVDHPEAQLNQVFMSFGARCGVDVPPCP
jgi:hypothetical protein